MEFASEHCVRLISYPVSIAADECTVVNFDSLGDVGGRGFYYARYTITTEVPWWPNLREIQPQSNAIVFFVASESGESVRIHRVFHEDLAEFVRYTFPPPEIIETERGKVLHVVKRSTGDGMYQWFNDEYWLSEWGEWRKLDVSSWYRHINDYLPPTFAVAGVVGSHFDIARLRLLAPVRKSSDADCCPSAGTVEVTFNWIGLELTIQDVRYKPEAKFGAKNRD